VTATRLLDTPLVRVSDYRCEASRHDAPFAEVHTSYTLAYVRHGSFGCKTRGRAYDLVRGAFLVGRPGDEYTCSHDHVVGDECLSFLVDPEVVEAVGGLGVWESRAIAPRPELMVLGELAQAVADGEADVALDEVGIWIAARFARLAADRARRASAPTPMDRKRAVAAAMRIDAASTEAFDLERAAKDAGLSQFHFLRLFANVLGVTPHQYLVRSRLRHAARLLADETISITDVALAVGFNDLSNFVRTFHRAAGVSPGTFRKAAGGDRKIFQARIGAAPHR
jgi:AraC family transcriptional regulator